MPNETIEKEVKIIIENWLYTNDGAILKILKFDQVFEKQLEYLIEDLRPYL